MPGAVCWDVRLCAGSEDSPIMAVLRDVAGCEVHVPVRELRSGRSVAGEGGVC